jgi:hypothetical protein
MQQINPFDEKVMPSIPSMTGDWMKSSHTSIILGWVTAILALISSAVGLFWQTAGEPFVFNTLYGQRVEIYGQGLYRYDTLFKAPLLRGTDAVILFFALPLLIFALTWAHCGKLRGQLLLVGVLSFFVYNATSLAFGVAYNRLFLLYLVYFPVSLFALITACLSIDIPALAERISSHFPRRLTAIFLIIAGCSVCVWLILIIGAIYQGEVPEGIDSFATEVTYFLDLGLIAPTAFLAAIQLLRRQPTGYLLAALILTLNAMIGPVALAQAVMQHLAGVAVSIGEQVVFVGIFILTSLMAAALMLTLLRSIQPEAPSES